MNANVLLDIYQAVDPYLPVVFTGLVLTASFITSLHVLLTRREPGSSIAWIALVWLVPLGGVIFYLMFGINRIRRRAESLRHQKDVYRTKPIVDVIDSEDLAETLPDEVKPLARLLPLVNRVVDRRLLPGAKMTPLFDGDQTFPAMIEAIENAKKSINFATYIFDNDETGRRFVEAFKKAKDRGVEVRILIDAAGLRYSMPSILRRMKRADLHCVRFLPSILPPHIMTINLRNHRKIMVVDGELGFTGGINIRDHHVLASHPSHPTRDLHFKVEGPVVAHLQEVFVDDWKFSAGEELRGPKYFPPIKLVGDTLARGIPDGPDENLDKLKWAIQGAITSAQKSVRIMTPYFIPDQSMISALALAALREVQVDIILPEKNNLPFVHWASMSHLHALLAWGCNVYFTPPPFDHSKLMVVDKSWFLCGSANLDPRSLRLNFEFNVECWNQEMASQLDSFVDSRVEDGTKWTFEDHVNRSKLLKLRDGVAALLSPYL